MKNRTGFTLAEVLITLGIIGVVAAMTIPTLNSIYRKKQLETQIKATYSTIQQAIRFAEYEDVSYSTVADGSANELKKWFDSFLGKHLKIEQMCVNRSPKGCWHQVYSPTGSPIGDAEGIGSGIIGFTLAKGATVTIDGYNSNDVTSAFGVQSADSGLVFFFDANGVAKPNTMGKDVFIMVWTEKGLVPAGLSKTKEQVKTNCKTGNGYWCLREVIDYGWVIPDEIWKRH